VLLWFPPIYYITTPEHYYRRPIDPLFVILALLAVMPKAMAKEENRLSDRVVTAIQAGD
jgi:hypothetical protein